MNHVETKRYADFTESRWRARTVIQSEDLPVLTCIKYKKIHKWNRKQKQFFCRADVREKCDIAWLGKLGEELIHRPLFIALVIPLLFLT